MIAQLALAWSLLQPCEHSQDWAFGGGKIHRFFNRADMGCEICLWPETHMVILTVGYQKRWHKCFRVW